MGENKPRVVVTGCVGFIASRVTQLLLDQGYDVIGVDNFAEAYDLRLKDWRLDQLKPYPHFHFHKVDIVDKKSIDEVITAAHAEHPIQAIIHLAARAGVRYSVENPWVYIDTNVTGTLNMLELCRTLGIKKFVKASTSSLYGGVDPPFKETQSTDTPLSPYAASKKGAEALCYTYHHLFAIDITVLRYFTVYGPAGRPDMAPFRFVQWISEGKPVTVFGDGTQERDFTYVDDIARGTIAGLQLVGYKVCNLGSDAPIVLNDVIKMIEDLVQKKANIVYKPRHPADPIKTWAVIENARTILKWVPQTTFEEGIKETVRWYQNNREWAKDVNTD